jgi:hypothetical protein
MRRHGIQITSMKLAPVHSTYLKRIDAFVSRGELNWLWE